MSDFRAFVETVFRVLEERKVASLVLRNYDELPEKTTNDVDILVDPAFLGSAERAVLAAAAETGWTHSNTGRFSCRSLFFFHPGTLQQAHIDLMPGVLWHSLVFADPRKMLSARLPFKCFFKPQPADEAWVDLATRWLYEGRVKEKYRPFIRSVCAAQPDSSRAVFSRFLGKRFADETVSLCAAGRWEDVERLSAKARFRILLKNLRRPISLFSRVLRDFFRFADRLRNPPGLIVGLAGPTREWRDEIADALTRGLSGTFYPERTFRWNGEPATRSVRVSARRNAFHGGLSILDFPSGRIGSFRCDFVFDEESFQSDDSGGRFFVVDETLGFLAGRTARRHA